MSDVSASRRPPSETLSSYRALGSGQATSLRPSSSRNPAMAAQPADTIHGQILRGLPRPRCLRACRASGRRQPPERKSTRHPNRQRGMPLQWPLQARCAAPSRARGAAAGRFHTEMSLRRHDSSRNHSQPSAQDAGCHARAVYGRAGPQDAGNHRNEGRRATRPQASARSAVAGNLLLATPNCRSSRRDRLTLAPAFKPGNREAQQYPFLLFLSFQSRHGRLKRRQRRC